jgi:hypothetical protein
MFVLTASVAQAQGWDDRYSDDSDLSWGTSLRMTDVPLELAPDQTQFEPGGDGLNVVVYRLVKGQPEAQHGLSFNAGQYLVESDGWVTAVGCSPGATVNGSAELASDRFSVTNGSRNYKLVFEAQCGGTLSLIYNEDSPAGQALGIWQVASTAQNKLNETVGLDFWRRNIEFVFPADADYYSWGTVHISRGDHWDVVGHEMGHAIYDQADIGAFGGGQHYIDRCYSGALALSEGWASYFSGWVNVALNDADAKFEYMVPRRAPIRFENVPEDVCAGTGSEWRVNAFFWDFIDSNDDGEQMNETFTRVWAALAGGNSGDVSAATRRLERAGFDTTVVNAIWALNFRENR